MRVCLTEMLETHKTSDFTINILSILTSLEIQVPLHANDQVSIQKSVRFI